MKRILIGKEGNQPFAIGDPNVSRQHAYLLIDEQSGMMQLVDNHSTNGTFVHNGQSFIRLFPGQPVNVSFNTMIQLGPNTRFHIRRLFQSAHPTANPATGGQAAQQQPPKKAEPKRVDIKHLHQISQHYNDESLEINSQTQKYNGLRACTFIVGTISTFGGKILAANLYGDDANEAVSWVIGVIIGVALITSLLWFINTNNEKLLKRKADNEHDYAVKYCCPVCHLSFKGKFYENILAEGSCPKCKTIYFDSTISK